MRKRDRVETFQLFTFGAIPRLGRERPDIPSTSMSLRVLIVEDHAAVATELAAVLGDLGHSVVGIADDTLSADQLARVEPDVALVDVNLRGGATGPAVAAQLVSAGVSVIFTTATPEQIPPDQAGLERLPKPWTLAQIDVALAQVAQLRAAAAEAVAV